MPLSENEQRILAEIEKHLQASDPRLAREVSRSSSPWVGGSLRTGILAAVAGLAILVLTLQVHFLLAFLGFLVMTAGALMIERSLSESIGTEQRRSGRGSLADSLRGSRPSFRRRNDR